MLRDDMMWLRLLIFAPLGGAAVQVWLLRRILNSRAWNLLTVGFALFVLVRGVALFTISVTIPLLTATFIGYACIAVGFYTLRQDLLRVLRAAGHGGSVSHDRRENDPKLTDPKAEETQ